MLAVDCQVFAEQDPAATTIDVCSNRAAVQYCWRTGTLPRELLKLTSIEVLVAPRLGLIYLEEWITQLTHLREIYIQGNEITTWPHFLSLLPNLELLVMDGNPCLELQLQKSMSFRNAFFELDGHPGGCSGGQTSRKSIPDLIRGPVWKPAVLKKSLSNKVCGMYCGGIYTVPTPRSAQDDFLTAMGPSRLERRRGMPPPLFENAGTQIGCKNSHLQMEQSRLVLRLLKGLYRLVKDCPKRSDLRKVTNENGIDQFILGKTSLVLEQEVGRVIVQESRYISHIDEAIQMFLSKAVPHQFVDELSAMLDPFPQIYLFHKQWLKCLHHSYKNRLLGREISVQRKRLNGLCKSFLQCLQRGSLDCYRSYAKTYISSQWRLWRYINHEYQFDEDEMDNAARLSEWLFRQATDNKNHSLEHATTYLDLPIKHLEIMEEFFNRVSQFDVREASSVCSALSLVCSDVKASVEASRRILGIGRLATVYHLSSKERVLVDKYIWDALLDVKMRVYMDPGLHRLQTFDTLCGGQISKSAVCEVFSSEQCMLRLIRSGDDIRVWDETVGQLICSFKHQDLDICICDRELVVIFRPVDDLFICRLVSFATIEVNSAGNREAAISERAFLNAVEDGKAG